MSRRKPVRIKKYGQVYSHSSEAYLRALGNISFLTIGDRDIRVYILLISIAYWVAFGPHGARTPLTGPNHALKVIGGTLAMLAVSGALYQWMRTLGKSELWMKEIATHTVIRFVFCCLFYAEIRFCAHPILGYANNFRAYAWSQTEKERWRHTERIRPRQSYAQISKKYM